ncbi:DUF1127 domain-containing protein [Pelagovum pacificum]|uniref:DUF1127 domain-containing protein n=1 Tax=Pelagovum pacificum TaxID=2588711 RepID=A0A5C5GE81_9RHOB|nr:DUF1127 domain-containing protein [Pelagovum pacificum]QQA44619.1 DUF1127 domain-containing protein [Pelagovum pacificum]TNY32269.1 DUF1127 domain-containing protein [Pelagovum pacificum]
MAMQTIHQLPAQSGLPPMTAVLYKLTVVAMAWEVRRKTRRDLKRLNDDQLRDIGLTRFEAESESNEPFWR